ncbi:MAG: YaiI/YqxD family protein [Acidobacteriota bacterium]|nr:YaiI/YqxD family protein [Acidobacteriota bacterium]
MRIWIDADACPRAAKDMVYRTADRWGIEAVLVANTHMRTPQSDFITVIVVGKGFDVADNYIADNVEKGDLVITADIPLAARIVDAGALGLDPRGQLFDEDNVKQKLATRNLLAQLRDQGMTGGGPPPYKPKDQNKFASALDALLTKMLC